MLRENMLLLSSPALQEYEDQQQRSQGYEFVPFNRVLIYSALTGTLALVYFGPVFVLQCLLRGFIGQMNDLTIVISTLAVAALVRASIRCQPMPSGMTGLRNLDQAHTTESSRRYRAYAEDCNHCPLKAQCTTSRQGRSLCRSVDETCLDRVRAYQSTEANKKALRKRQVWVEPLFAEAKDWHGMRRFRLRRLWQVNCEAFHHRAESTMVCCSCFTTTFLQEGT